MTPDERLQYIDIGLRVANIELHKDLLKRVVLIVDLVDEKKGKTDLKDIIHLLKKENERT